MTITIVELVFVCFCFYCLQCFSVWHNINFQGFIFSGQRPCSILRASIIAQLHFCANTFCGCLYGGVSLINLFISLSADVRYDDLNYAALPKWRIMVNVVFIYKSEFGHAL